MAKSSSFESFVVFVVHLLSCTDMIKALILDVDGVLLDARPSYHAVAEEAARRAVARILGEQAARAAPFDRTAEVAVFKAAGGFNDDWEMSRAIGILIWLRAQGRAPPLREFVEGGGVERLARRWSAPAAMNQASIARDCGSLYGGRSHCRLLFGFDPPADAPERGYWEREELLVDRELLERVAARMPVALFTGRNPGEAELALLRTGLAVPPGLRWVADGRPRKPDPEGLLRLCAQMLPPRGGAGFTGDGPEPKAEASIVALFIGDTADDRAAAEAAQAGGAPLRYAHVQEPGDTARALAALLNDT